VQAANRRSLRRFHQTTNDCGRGGPCMWSFLVLFLFGVVFAECLVCECGLGVRVIVRAWRGAGRAAGRAAGRDTSSLRRVVSGGRELVHACGIVVLLASVGREGSGCGVVAGGCAPGRFIGCLGCFCMRRRVSCVCVCKLFRSCVS
jgi:hypothetical protein